MTPLGIKRKRNILSADFAEGTVLFDLRRRRPYILNSVGREIWRKSGRLITTEATSDYLVKKYAVVKKEARRDLESLFKKLLQKGLVEYVATK